MVTNEERVFDADSWRKRVDVAPGGYPGLPNYWNVQCVTGPNDATRVTHLRELCRQYVDPGPSEPIDLFLLGIGKPSDQRSTKIGGAPFWPRHRALPATEHGELIPFLAQFNFSRSREIVGQTPSDILTVFWNRSQDQTPFLEWVDASSVAEHGLESVGEYNELPEFLGIRWRVDNYPHWRPRDAARWSGIQLPDGFFVSDPFLVFHLLGMQIGGNPVSPRFGTTRESGEKVIASIYSVVPTSDVNWPFTNRERPLTESEADELTIHLTLPNDGTNGLGVMHFILAPSGITRTEYSVFY